MITSVQGVILIGTTLVAGAIGTNLGIKYERAVWQERFIEQEAREKQALVDHEKLVADLNKMYQESLYKSEKEKEHAIKLLKHDYSTNSTKRLSVSASVCKGTASTTAATGPTIANDGTAGTVELPEQVTRNLWSEAFRADEIVENYRALQHWLTYQGLYATESRN